MTNSHSSNQHGCDSSTLNRLERRLQEAYEELWGSFVDPRDALFDVDGMPWLPVGFDADVGAPFGWGPTSETQLREIRNQCRLLALSNEFAINGHENRISFVVGAGHTYSAAAKKGQQVPPAWIAAVQDVLDDFIQANCWQRRQQEIVLRRDRDGEVFLRFFVASDGTTRVRFVEPGQIATPPDQPPIRPPNSAFSPTPATSRPCWPITSTGKRSTPTEIQHRKANVDANVRRGLPLFFPGAQESSPRGKAAAEHERRGRDSIGDRADPQASSQQSRRGRAVRRRQRRRERHEFRHWPVDQLPPLRPRHDSRRPGRRRLRLSRRGHRRRQFRRRPASRAASDRRRLVMPEFMLSSDASNANYASTMVAEGPAMRMFQRLQAEQVADDLEVMWRVVANAVAAGRLPSEVQTTIEITGVAPTLATRDQLQETQRFQIENAAGILSPQTWSQRLGLDYDQEQANLAAHAARTHGNQKPTETDAAAQPLDTSAANLVGV